MPNGTLAERLAAVERALDDAAVDGSGASAPADGTLADRVADLEDRVGDLEEGVADIEAAVQAVRGYVGDVRHVNEEVERRADAALAKAETVEGMLTPGEAHPPDWTTADAGIRGPEPSDGDDRDDVDEEPNDVHGGTGGDDGEYGGSDGVSGDGDGVSGDDGGLVERVREVL